MATPDVPGGFYRGYRRMAIDGNVLNLILHPIQQLADGSSLAKIYPNACAREKDRHGIVVRVIRDKLEDFRFAMPDAPVEGDVTHPS